MGDGLHVRGAKTTYIGVDSECQVRVVGSVSLVGRLNTLSWAVYSGDSTLSAHHRGRGTPVADSHILDENARTRASPSPWPPGHLGHLALSGLSGQAHHSGLLSAWSPQPPCLTPATWADLGNMGAARDVTLDAWGQPQTPPRPT